MYTALKPRGSWGFRNIDAGGSSGTATRLLKISLCSQSSLQSLRPLFRLASLCLLNLSGVAGNAVLIGTAIFRLVAVAT